MACLRRKRCILSVRPGSSISFQTFLSIKLSSRGWICESQLFKPSTLTCRNCWKIASSRELIISLTPCRWCCRRAVTLTLQPSPVTWPMSGTVPAKGSNFTVCGSTPLRKDGAVTYHFPIKFSSGKVHVMICAASENNLFLYQTVRWLATKPFLIRFCKRCLWRHKPSFTLRSRSRKVKSQLTRRNATIGWWAGCVNQSKVSSTGWLIRPISNIQRAGRVRSTEGLMHIARGN